MIKKIVALLICICMIASLVGVLGACTNQQLKIVYLGDSIAEALIGPSPVSERENYGYFSIVGRRNNFNYINRSVSGHQSAGLLNLLKQPDEGGLRTISHIKTADIIHVSILGNDFLQTNLGETILLAAQDNFIKVDDILANAKINFSLIYDVLRSYNKDAIIMFQTVYNPVSPESDLVKPDVRVILTDMGIHEDTYRSLGEELLTKLNGIITTYLTEHPDAFYITDAYQSFDNIYKEDAERGKGLVFQDGVHPSNEGHAVIADTIQLQLEELNLVNGAKALKNYKAIRLEQIKRMFDGKVDYAVAKKQIKNAQNCQEVTKIYFATIGDKLPIYC